MAWLAASAAAQKPDARAVEFFETNVRPVLVKNCQGCHGAQQQQSSLRLDSREAMLKGGNRGPALAPGNSRESLIAKAVRHQDIKMPVGGKLKDTEIAAIEKWIDQGAAWPEEAAKGTIGPGHPGYYEKLKREHWAFQPVVEAKLPAFKNSAWSAHPIDRFVLASLEKAGLSPAQPADRASLARRLSYVLTGLPPTPLEVDLFVRDQSPNAYERLVDRLLSSQHYGEHQARHWMDVMRFAETFGNDWNYEILGAWHYRDYLIRAFNDDVPFDQLVREHVAGDLLAKPRVNQKDGINESEIGTTFFRLGELGHDDCIRFRQIRTDVVDNQIDTLGKAFQGLTIACARCHDHKLDPIPTSDYYALYGVLTSSRMVSRTFDLPAVNESARRRLAEMKPRIRAELARAWKQQTGEIPRYLMAAYRAWRGAPPAAEDSALKLDRVQSLLAAIEVLKPKMEEPLSLWAKLGDATGPGLGEKWSKAAAEYKEEARARAAFNRENFRPFGDFEKDGFGGWQGDGNAMGSPSPDGEFTVASSGDAAVTGIFPSGLYTHALSERLNGALRSPVVPKDKKFVSLLAMGGKLGARRTVLDNCMLSEDYQTFEQDALAWIKVPNRDDQPTLPFYIELATKSDNTRIPDRPGRLKATPEQLADPKSYFGIARAVIHDVDETPKDELGHMQRLFEGRAPASFAELAERYAAVAFESLSAWEQGRATAGDVAWLSWLLDKGLLENSRRLSPAVTTLLDDYRATEATIGTSRVILGLADMEKGYDFPVLVGGDAAKPGPMAPRGFLQLINSRQTPPVGSGRLELAEMIASPSNPLTARVMVNRVWQQLFGTGIVATADNFGAYGEKPSHPELLDYLAAKFVRDGWSVRKLIRDIAMSQTFQQSAVGATSANDPLNRLLAHYPVHRMQAESIRDTLLAVSGRLDRTLYGPSINPHRDEPKDYRKLHQGPLDGDGRRSIYVKVTRHEGSRFLDTFDFPNPNIARGNRDSSNVPSQALALLNDPFVTDQAAFWANRLVGQESPSVEARIDAMFRAALGRLPDGAERERFVGLTRELASLHKVESDKILGNKAVWKDVAHAMFNLKELIYIR